MDLDDGRDVRLHWPKAEKALAEGEESSSPRFQAGGSAAAAGAGRGTESGNDSTPSPTRDRCNDSWKNRPSQPSTDVLLAKDRDE